MDYDSVISIGSNCRVAEALKDTKLRKQSLPFDWVLSSLRGVHDAFYDDFKNYFNRENCTLATSKESKHPHILNTKYHINITHEKSLNDVRIKKLKERCDRLIKILETGGDILLIRNLMDCELTDPLHKSYRKDEEALGHSDLDINWLVKLKEMLVSKYPKSNIDILVIHYSDIDTKPYEEYIKFEKTTIDTKIRGNDRASCGRVIKKLNIKLK